MYDELVKELRDSAEWADRLALMMGRAEGDVHAPAMRKAADAIEELSKPRWIPVTERLPNGEAERYLVAASLMSLGLRVSICYYADNLEEVDEYDFKDENHGGFYGYDDEYGYYERSGVKYWMPLPTPPTAEEGE